MSKLAYAVTALGSCAGDEDFQSIYFLTEQQAADAVANGCRVERHECFDQYAEEGEVPAEAYYRNGWYQECDHCYRQFSDDGPDDDEDSDDGDDDDADARQPRPRSPQFEGLLGFCSRSCHTAWKDRRDRIETIRAEACERLKQRCPWVTKATWWTGGSGCSGDCYEKNRENQCADIRFEGETHGGGTYCHGCRTARINPNDLPAWNAAKERHATVKASKEAAT